MLVMVGRTVWLWLICTLCKTLSQKQPNFVLFLADDFGYGDLSCYGHPTQEPGAADKLAQEGLRFTQMYSPSVFCTPSRAALLTGRQPHKLGMYGPSSPVLLPCHSGGLPKEEVTIAEALVDVGYSTGIVGKWHLGINENVYNDGLHLPLHHGFQHVGTILPFTLTWSCDTSKRHVKNHPSAMSCFLYNNMSITQQPIVLEDLSASILNDAKAFLYNQAKGNKPFFLYVSLPQTHTPMFNHPNFKGKSKRGIYGDQVNEMNWLIGEVMAVIQELEIANETLSIFASDHGPHLEICEEGGDQGPFTGGKGYYFEGGLRVPAIAHWPGIISPGTVSSTVVSLMDLYGTFLALAGIDVPLDRDLDGKNLLHVFSDPLAETSHEIMLFFCGTTLMAVRYKQYKIHYYHLFSEVEDAKSFSCIGGGFPVYNLMAKNCGHAVELNDPWIFNVEKDTREEHRLSYVPPNIIEEVTVLVENYKDNFDARDPLFTKANCHRSLIPCCNPPYCVCNFIQNH